jgi:hypothetical protein
MHDLFPVHLLHSSDAGKTERSRQRRAVTRLFLQRMP